MSGMKALFPIQNGLLNCCTFSLKICRQAATCTVLADEHSPVFDRLATSRMLCAGLETNHRDCAAPAARRQHSPEPPLSQ